MSASTRDADPYAAPARTRRGRMAWRLLGLLLCALIAAGIVYTVWFWPAAKPAIDAPGRGRTDTIPVVAAHSATKDVPIYLDGLGTVQASETVTVKSLVDGTLLEVDFKEGDTVHVGDVLAKVDPRLYQATYDQAVAKKQQDAATLANARVDLTRYQKLSATAYSSTQQFDTQRALVAQLEAQVAGDQAQVDNAQTQLGYTTIRSPIDGRIGIRQVDAGNIVHAADATGLVVITRLQPIYVIFTLPQQNLPQVAAAMKAGEAEALAVAQGQDGASARVLDRGTLSVLDNMVDNTTGTIKLKATFPNAEQRLWPGGFVGIKLQIRIDHGAITVPPSAIQRGPSGAYVYVVADGHAVRREVTVGHEDEDVSIVRSGLGSGEQIVIDGASRLTDGSKVTLTSDAPNTGPVGAQAPGTASRRRRNASP